MKETIAILRWFFFREFVCNSRDKENKYGVIKKTISLFKRELISMVNGEKILYTYKELIVFHLLIITPFVVFAFFCFFSIYFWIGLLIVGAIYVAYRKMFHKVIFYEDQIKAKSFFLSKIYDYKDTIDVRILRENNIEPPVVQLRFKSDDRLSLTPKSRLDALALMKVLRSKDIKFIKTEEYTRFINWEKTKEMSENDWS